MGVSGCLIAVLQLMLRTNCRHSAVQNVALKRICDFFRDHMVALTAERKP